MTLNKLRNIILELVVVMVLGYLMQVLVFCIPSKLIEKNVYDSAMIMQKEGVYPPIYAAGTYVDNWTDADCVAVAYNTAFSNPFKNAMNGYQNYSSSEENKFGTNNLVDSMLGDTDSISNHTHLWHGFRIWLRPLLIWFNISQIRTIISCISLITLCILYNNLIQKCGNKWIGAAFVLAFGLSGLHLESVSLLVFTDTFIMMGATIAILKFENLGLDRAEDIFTITGSILAFSSMLIIPIITLMIPLAIYLFINRYKSMFDKIRLLILCGFRWGLGYGVVLGSKIIISEITSINSQAKNQVSRYLGISGDLNITTRLAKVREILDRLYESNMILVLFITIILIVSFGVIVLKFKDINCKIPTYILFLVVGISPLVWCFFVAGHVHHNFTLFNFVISSFSLIVGFVYLIEEMGNVEGV